MSNDKPVTMKELSEILRPLSEAVSRIDQSLWLMAQLQLAAEFEPDQAQRQIHYQKLADAELAHKKAREALTEAQNNKPLPLPDVGHTELVKLHGKEKADEQYKPVIDAMAQISAASDHRTAIENAAPVLTRLREAWKR
ncbi:hypothetical protein F6476_00130 (plasmid) [Pseudomonas umsongensis]|nr:hypothetical protein [Pseudomonas umsongensis]AEV45845.1 putative palsmid partitioning protein ParC [Pseudomonas sp. MC1]QFG27695.1 hypothetical protein F6476_00130 [Pseudomonas umsongensis]UPU95697.1 hypothetical protein M0766_29870 [Pseudomonas putida]BAE92124.1 putative plasmid partitioning protein ParC [Pseudomonas putida]